MTSIVYEDVDGFQFVDEFEKLFPLHYEELCVTKEFPYEPNYEAYKKCANAGVLRCITCRADGELIGYIIFFVTPHLHYKSCMTATEDIYFLKKEYRKGRIGIRLFQYAEKVLNPSLPRLYSNILTISFSSSTINMVSFIVHLLILESPSCEGQRVI